MKMAKKPIDRAKHDGMFYASKAEKAGCKVSFPNNHTVVVHSRDGMRAGRFPTRITDSGTETLVRRFLKSLGILLILVLAAILIF